MIWGIWMYFSLSCLGLDTYYWAVTGGCPSECTTVVESTYLFYSIKHCYFAMKLLPVCLLLLLLLRREMYLTDMEHLTYKPYNVVGSLKVNHFLFNCGYLFIMFVLSCVFIISRVRYVFMELSLLCPVWSTC